MTEKYIFVEHSHGEFEGTSYNKIVLSNGLRALSFKNKTSDSDELLASLKEGDEVVCEIAISFGKQNLIGSVKSIERA